MFLGVTYNNQRKAYLGLENEQPYFKHSEHRARPFVFYMSLTQVECWFVQDLLRGEEATEIRVKFIKKLEDALPAGED